MESSSSNPSCPKASNQGRQTRSRAPGKRLITQGDLLAGQNNVFNLRRRGSDYAARQAQADAAEAVRVAAQRAAEKAQMSLFEKPSMPYVPAPPG
jgi:hypothetical protein